MRFFSCVLALVIGVAGCTKHNPASCCSTPDQCTSFGLDGVTGCDGSDVCDATGTCVAPVCTAASDCPSGDDCVGQLCVPFGPPAGLSYSASYAIYTETIPIQTNTPLSNGGPILSYDVTPALPAGLTIDPATGIISGTPIGYTALDTYTVTATNDAGNTTTTLSIGVNARDLFAGGNNFMCARVNGAALCWGDNTDGQLGDTSTTGSLVEVSVSTLHSGVQAIASSAQARHVCAVVNGGAQCWGDNSDGDLGNNSTTESNVPVSVTGLTGVQQLAPGTTHTCALLGKWLVPMLGQQLEWPVRRRLDDE